MVASDHNCESGTEFGSVYKWYRQKLGAMCKDLQSLLRDVEGRELEAVIELLELIELIESGASVALKPL